VLPIETTLNNTIMSNLATGSLGDAADTADDQNKTAFITSGQGWCKFSNNQSAVVDAGAGDWQYVDCQANGDDRACNNLSEPVRGWPIQVACDLTDTSKPCEVIGVGFKSADKLDDLSTSHQ
jgi:hypothetical protein